MAKSYESEATQFLQELKRQRPYLEAQQKEGRARLWDKKIDAEDTQAFEAGTVAQKPYVYSTND